MRNTIKVRSTSSNRNRLRKGRRSTSPPGASCFRFLCAARTQSFPPPGTLCAAGTQSFPPPGTLWTGGTQYFQPLPSLLDWRDSVRLPPQVPRRLVGLSYLPPRYPMDWWGSVPSATTEPWDREARQDMPIKKYILFV